MHAMEVLLRYLTVSTGSKVAHGMGVMDSLSARTVRYVIIYSRNSIHGTNVLSKETSFLSQNLNLINCIMKKLDLPPVCLLS